MKSVLSEYIYRYGAFASLALLLLASSCNPAKHLADGEYLLVKNKVDISNPHKKVSQSDVASLIAQKPNDKLFGIFQFKLWVHYSFDKGWLHRELGQPPAKLDLSLVKESRKRISQYLNNTGFFYSAVDTSITRKSNKKAKVTYNVTLAEPYRYEEIDYEISNSVIKELALKDTANSLLDKGSIYDAYTLDDERDRITDHLRDNGYYDFTKNHIFYEIDSTKGRRQMDLFPNIKDKPVYTGSEYDLDTVAKHRRYKINRIYVYPDFKAHLSDTLVYDTMKFIARSRDDSKKIQYRLLYSPPLKINPTIISQSLFIEKDDYYRISRVRKTNRRLNDLSIFRFVDIQFDRLPDTSSGNGAHGFLDCSIHLSRAPVHSYSVELQGTNSGGDLGIVTYLVYRNKNIFRGAETFTLRIKGAVEAQKYTATAGEDEIETLPFFNTYESGVDASVRFPKFLLPVPQERFSKTYQPTTTIKLGYNYQDRPDYKRFLTNIAFGYEWQETKYKQHELFPADISLISMNPTPAFDSLLISLGNPILISQYTDHLITALRYSFIFNNQDINRERNFIYLRATVETSGNILNTIQQTGGVKENEEGYRTLFNIRYSQYVRPNVELRYYFLMKNQTSLVFRTYTGLGIPYGNSESLPFEKGYFAGGANGMRGWQLRSLGPGSYSGTTLQVERAGDVQVEGNIEYRFPIYDVLNGALFTDIGNIWLLREDETFPGGKFNFDDFHSELAVDGGLGFRLDFNFFVIRFDAAHKLKDPSRPAGDRWILNNLKWKTIVWNLGIGYPF